MAEEKRLPPAHSVILEERRRLSITGVTDIDSFDEENVLVYTEAGELMVHGAGIHINRIDVASGELLLEGDITGMEYTDNPPARGGLWAKLFR